MNASWSSCFFQDFTPTGGPRPTEGPGGATENAVTEDGGPAGTGPAVTGPAGGDGGE